MGRRVVLFAVGVPVVVTKDEAVRWIREKRKKAREGVDGYIDDLRKKSVAVPVCQIVEHSDYVLFTCAAQFYVLDLAYDALTGKKSKATVETLAVYALREVLVKAGSRHSTSMTSRIMHAEIVAAWAMRMWAARIEAPNVVKA